MHSKIHAYAAAGLTLLSVLLAFSCTRKAITASAPPPVETGVSRTLADYRKEMLRDIAYTLHLDIPSEKTAPIQASETIAFYSKDKVKPLQIDFKESSGYLQKVTVNGREIPVLHTKEHLLIPGDKLKKGRNTIAVVFTAGELSLNRNEEFLYTLLVPDRARTVFPVFDQPNLKASFKLSLTLPQDWNALANAPLQDSTVAGDRKTYHYAASDTISTYLFSFTAGKFKKIAREAGGRKMHFYHRETDANKLKLSLDPIFHIHADALAFMEDYTQIPYPFQKFDFVAIPDFQYGGMEHVGAIVYKASTLFLDEGATRDQEISRSSLISHETAHMWFGDLVTMQWFNDVWMKEVFANFMADKITQTAVANSNYDLKFLIDHFPAAYGVDRTAGANPIRQELDNLQDAGTMYGNIIYHKAPIMMRQLERLMGEEKFKLSLRQYLKQYAYGNATWPDLISIMDANTPADLQAWNQVWVEEPSRPVFDYDLKTEGRKITAFTLSQKGEDGSERIWPQFFEVALVYKDRVEELTINMNQRQVKVEEAEGKAQPLFLLFNSSGQGYGQFPVAQKHGEFTTDLQHLAKISELEDPVMRASAYINLYENMLAGKGIDPNLMLSFTALAAEKEKEELNLKLLTGQMSTVFWKYLSPAKRTALAETLENSLWTAMEKQNDANKKKLLFNSYQSIALTNKAQDKLYRIWQHEKAPDGVRLTEDDYTSLALALAVRDNEGNILKEQLRRIQNPDRQNRLRFLMPALSADVTCRDAFFTSLKRRENREKEAWVGTALHYLHHPLRAATSQKYLKESLELIEEIQLTGDIFFPANWLQSTLGFYQSTEAAQAIRTFLNVNPELNPKLKAKVLQAADGVFRAEKLVQ